MFEIVEINDKDYYYKAFRIGRGFILVHNWNSPEGKVLCISFPWKLISVFLRHENNKGAKNRASALSFIIRLWRFELSLSIGWHNDKWGLIL